jgi:hypothetical protein
VDVGHAGLQEGIAAFAARITKQCARRRGNYNLPHPFYADCLARAKKPALLILILGPMEQEP